MICLNKDFKYITIIVLQKQAYYDKLSYKDDNDGKHRRHDAKIMKYIVWFFVLTMNNLLRYCRLPLMSILQRIRFICVVSYYVYARRNICIRGSQFMILLKNPKNTHQIYLGVMLRLSTFIS